MTDAVIAPRSPRRWFRFRLRTLLVVGPLLAIAVAMGLRGWYLEYRHAWALDQISRHGGVAIRNGEQQVISVELPGSSIDDEKLRALIPALAALPHLEKLVLASNAVTDAGLAHIAPLQQLKVVYLANTKVTGAGIVKLKEQRPDLVIDVTTPHPRAMRLASRPIYQHAIVSLALAPDGTLISGSGGGQIQIWDIGRRSLAAQIDAHTAWTFALAAHPALPTIASAGGDGQIKLWSWATGQRTTTLDGHTDDVHGLAFTPDGHALVTSSDDLTVRIWDVAAHQSRFVLEGHEDTIPAVAVSPDGTLAASASRDHTIRLWKIATGQCLGVLAGHTGDVMSVDFHPGRPELASASYDGTVKLWDIETLSAKATLTGHRGWAFAVRYSPDGARLVSTAADGVRLWDPSGRKLLWHAQDQRDVAAALWLSNDSLATAAAEGSICLYHLDGSLWGRMWTRFSPDDRRYQELIDRLAQEAPFQD